MTTHEKLLHAATSGGCVVEEISRGWRETTDDKGDIVLALICVELVYYSVLLARYVWKWWQGRRVKVKETYTEWRSKKRERVIATYRTDTDRRHPNYERRR